jgi:hypothetical protein
LISAWLFQQTRQWRGAISSTCVTTAPLVLVLAAFPLRFAAAATAATAAVVVTVG